MATKISVKIRKKRDVDSAEIVKLVNLLPEYFPEPNLGAIETNIDSLRGFVAIFDNEIVGFISFLIKSNNAEIYAMAVHPSFQRCGIGQRLIEAMEETLRSQGIKRVQVNTLAETPKFANFQKTRKFYAKLGYKEKAYFKDTADSSIEILVLEKTL